jgi:hypothetical protein
MISTLVFIDSAVSDYQHLLQEIDAQAKVIILEADQDGLEQLTEVVATHPEISSLHIVSHGSPGELQLGNTHLNQTSLPQYVHRLKTWRNHLTPTASIFLYGCQVAAGTEGLEFIQAIHNLTGAAVAASQNLTGNAGLGGNWDLEVAIGSPSLDHPFHPKALATYSGVLATLLFAEGFIDDDVDVTPWIFGQGEQVGGIPTQNPFLTARATTAASPGGLPGSPTGVALDPIGDGALRLTNNQENQSAFVIYNDTIPSNAGLQITFEFYAYDTATTFGADGISFFLIDGAASPVEAGAFGGSLGYAQRNEDALGNPIPEIPGLVGGYVGIGFDEFGNFSADTEGRNGGNPTRVPDSVAIRGSEAIDYLFLEGTGSLAGSIDEPAETVRDNARRTARVTLTRSGTLSVELDLNNDLDFDDANELVIAPFDLATANGAPLPANLKFGWAASTGGSTNIHEIRNLEIFTLTEPPIITTTDLIINTTGPTPVTGITIVDPNTDPIDFVAILTLPPTDQGTLYIGDPNNGGTPITNLPNTSNTIGQPFFQLTPAQVNQLVFVPSPGFTGTTFSFTATDTFGAIPINPGVVTLLPPTSEPTAPGTPGEPVPGTPEPGEPGEPGEPLGCAPGVRRRGNAQPNRLIGTDDRDRLGGLDGNDRMRGLGCNDLVDGGRGNDRLGGNGALDTLQGRQGNDLARGGPGADLVRGGLGNDVVKGDRGNDRVSGGMGRDRAFGGSGDDVVRGDFADDFLSGNRGNDLLNGGQGNDRLRGGPDDDILHGNQNNDRLAGDRGNDIINGGLGDDQGKGGAGNDSIRGGRGRDRFRGGNGDDEITGNALSDFLGGNRGNDVIDGGGGRDLVRGGPGNDFVAGGRRRDRVGGGKGDDLVFGGGGRDILLGNVGSDQFIYTNIRQRGDRITDFEVAVDQVNLNGLFARPEYAGSADPFADYVRLRRFAGGGTLVQVDANDNGNFIDLALLQGVAPNTVGVDNFIV